jgi:hypothetical protein
MRRKLFQNVFASSSGRGGAPTKHRFQNLIPAGCALMHLSWQHGRNKLRLRSENPASFAHGRPPRGEGGEGGGKRVLGIPIFLYQTHSPQMFENVKNGSPDGKLAFARDRMMKS